MGTFSQHRCPDVTSGVRLGCVPSEKALQVNQEGRTTDLQGLIWVTRPGQTQDASQATLPPKYVSCFAHRYNSHTLKPTTVGAFQPFVGRGGGEEWGLWGLSIWVNLAEESLKRNTA